MNLTQYFKLAINSLRTSKMRAFLTMLGIIIGVAAVIVIVGLGNGLEGYVTDSFSDMGTDTLNVNSWHHQGIHTVGDGLTEIAWATDGIVENSGSLEQAITAAEEVFYEILDSERT